MPAHDPVDVPAWGTRGPRYAAEKCIDDSACEEVLYWKPEDGRPEKTGTYRSVMGLRIDKSKVGEVRVFSAWGWSIALIVSEDIKDALERTGATGMKFIEV